MNRKRQEHSGGNFLQIAGLVATRSCSAVWRCARCFPFNTGLLVLLVPLAGVAPVVGITIGKYLVDSVTAYLAGRGAADLLYPVILILGLQLLWESLSLGVTVINGYASARLSNMVSLEFREEVWSKVIALDSRHFDAPSFRDSLHRTTTQSDRATSSLMTEILSFCTKLFTLGTSVSVLFLFSPYLCSLAALLAFPGLVLDAMLAQQRYAQIVRRTERVRKQSYMDWIITEREYARENLLMGLGQHFLDKAKTLFRLTMYEDLDLVRKRSRVRVITGMARSSAQLGIYIYIAAATASEGGTLGSLILNVGLFTTAQTNIQGLASALTSLYNNAILLNDYSSFRNLQSHIEGCKGGLPLDGPIESIRFENVAFAYPGSERQAIRGVSFSIGGGERVCLVGRNGAGKSTAVKLMLRLYDVDSGRILINGRDIKDYSLASLRSASAVLMQDFPRYALSLKENVVVGAIDDADNEVRFWEAVRSAGLETVVQRLPRNENTVLGKAFGDGEDLSLGEWQCLGLARVLFRRSSLNILDEPTSALDAVAEEKFLARFQESANAGISIIISHRLSAARTADRILVFEAGRIAECGTHLELMQNSDGVYAGMFRLQEKRYTGNAVTAGEAEMCAATEEFENRPAGFPLES